MKKFIFLPMLLLTGLLVTACKEDYFDQARQATNSASDRWGSTQQLENLVASAYYGASGYEGFRGIHGLQMVHEALLSDLAYLHANAVTEDGIADIYNRQNTRNDITLYANMWRGAYQATALANEVIGWIDTKGTFKDQQGPVWTGRILGEALFIRSWVYFTLVRMHAPAYGADNSAPSVILNLDPSKDAFRNPGRATVQQVYDQLVTDLGRAVELLPEAYNAQRDPIGYQDRANRDAARFLLMRVHFQMKNFAAAKEQADVLLNSGKYALTEEPLQAWNKTGAGLKGKEVVWQYVQFNTAQQQWKSSPVGAYLGFTSRGSNTINGGRVLSASDAFLAAAGWTPDQFTITNLPASKPPAVLPTAANFVISGHPDKRLTQLWRAIPAGYDPKPEYTGYTRTYVWANKWNRSEGNNNLFSLPLMRSAEAYLTRAIIRFRAGDRAGANLDVNAVRTRAGLTALSDAELTEDAIHVERMRELAFEEDRLYYLQALDLPILPGDRADSGPEPWNSPRFAMPIPSIETDLNPGAR